MRIIDAGTAITWIIKGIHISNVIIEGNIDLSGQTIESELNLFDSEIRGYLNLSMTIIKGGVWISSTEIKGYLDLRQAKIEGDLSLRGIDGSTLHNELLLEGVSIRGYLNLAAKKGPTVIYVEPEIAEIVHWAAPNIPIVVRQCCFGTEVTE